MEPKIVIKPAFKAVGIAYHGKNQNSEIAQMWDRFIPRINEPRRINPDTSYGLCFFTFPGAAEGEFEYVAAVEVENDADVPDGMVYREVPEYKYAIFTHHGSLKALGETYQYIYSTGVAQAGLQVHPDKYDMEVYNEDFTPGADDSKLYIYVAIQ